jgi:RNA polymerase sigma-70 factor (ECF subfamily)
MASEHDARLRRAVAQHYTFVWRTLRRCGLPDEEAEDLAQEVFILFSRKLETVPAGLEKGFLFRSAENVALQARRTYSRRLVLEANALALQVDVSPSAESDVERQEELALLDALLAELPNDLRSVVLLCELEEMTMGEAASILGIPQGTVASRLRRAKEFLSARVDQLQKQRP